MTSMMGGGLSIKGVRSKVTAYQCEFVDSKMCGVLVQTGQLVAQSCLFARNYGSGLSIGGKTAKVEIESCEITKNGGSGVELSKGGVQMPELEGNWIHENGEE